MRSVRALAATALAVAVLAPAVAVPVAASAASPQDAVASLQRLPGGGLARPIAGSWRDFRVRAVDQAGAGVSEVTLSARIVQGPNAPTADDPGSAVSCTTTASDGSASCSFRPTRAGTDTLRVHVDRSGGSTGVHDPGEPSLDATFSTEPAPNTTATEARVISMDPESTTFSSRPDTLRGYVATVRDRTGLAVQGVSVEFTEEGAGALEGGAAGITRTTDDLGRAFVTAGSYGDVGTQVITGRIATTGTECGRAADDPGGAPAGVCADTSTVTYCPDCGPAPPPGPTPAPESPSPTPVPESPSPTPTPTPHQDCVSGEQLEADRSVIVAGDGVSLTVRSTPDTAVELLGYIRPATTRGLLASLSTGADGVATTTLRPLGNTRLEARQRSEDCAFAVGSRPSIVVAVRTRLTLSAVRAGTRDYVFSGRALPVRPGQLVSLYRLTPDQRQVLTSRSAVREDGVWTVHRRFTGSGRFPFVARTGGDLTNAAGVSNVRLTVIH